MRFRTNVEDVSTFSRLVQSIAQLQKRCIVKFTPDIVQLICTQSFAGSAAAAGGAGDSGIQVWSTVKVPALFADYRIQSNAANEITMVLAADALSAALRSVAAGAATGAGPGAGAGAGAGFETTGVVMKLAKKNELAVLSFEVAAQTRMGRRVAVVHDVRIEVMKPADVARLREPLCPEPETHILLPPLSKLRTIVERLRPISDVLAIRADNAGRLQLAVRTESVSLETTWNGCPNPNMNLEDPLAAGSQDPSQAESTQSRRDPDELATVHVSLRTFLKFLGAHVVNGTTIAGICQAHCVVLYVYLGEIADAGGVLTFYIPAMVDD